MHDLDLDLIECGAAFTDDQVTAALVAAVRWAQDAPHHPPCMAAYVDPDGVPNPGICICGRDEALAPFKADQ